MKIADKINKSLPYQQKIEACLKESILSVNDHGKEGSVFIFSDNSKVIVNYSRGSKSDN